MTERRATERPGGRRRAAPGGAQAGPRRGHDLASGRDRLAPRHRGRGGDRGVPPRPAADHRRRRGPRERGRRLLPGRRRGRRGGQLHGHARARPDLHRDDRRAPGRARAAADDREQHRAAQHGLHGQRRSRRRGDHRHLGSGPRAHRGGADGPDLAARGSDPAGPHVPAARAGRRGARPCRADRGLGGPREAGGPRAGGGDLRGDAGRRHDGAGARSDRVRARARAQDRDGRRPDRVPIAQRHPDRARERGRAADGARRVPSGDLPHADRRKGARPRW